MEEGIYGLTSKLIFSSKDGSFGYSILVKLKTKYRALTKRYEEFED